MNTHASGPDNIAAERQFLTFTVGQEAYGVEILRVQEIKGCVPITPIPNTPPYVKGVMNLRGAVIPVADLRQKFGLADAVYDQFSVIIVITVGARTMGVVVDSVSDVLTVSEADIQPPPEFGGQIDTAFIAGTTQAADKLAVLLDIEKVLGDDPVPLGSAS